MKPNRIEWHSGLPVQGTSLRFETLVSPIYDPAADELAKRVDQLRRRRAPQLRPWEVLAPLDLVDLLFARTLDLQRRHERK